MTQTAKLTISTPPPSVNQMWRAQIRGGKPCNILSKEGRKWRKMAGNELQYQRGIKGDCYWSADIQIPGRDTKCDIDNYCKGILDALGHFGKTPDDSYLMDLRIRFATVEVVTINVTAENFDVWAKIRCATAYMRKKLGG